MADGVTAAVAGATLARRTRREISIAAVLANAAGGAVVVVFLQWLTLGTGVSDRNSQLSVAIAGTYSLASGVVGYLRAGKVLAPTGAWLEAGRPPTPREQAATLAHPARLAAQFFEYWAGAAVLFGVLNGFAFHNPSVRIVQVAGTIVVGGLTTCMVLFLTLERRLRPVFAVALSVTPPSRPATIGIRPRLVLSWALGSGVALIGLVLLPLATGKHGPVHLVGSVVFLACSGLVAGLVLTFLAAGSVADPIDEVRAGLRHVQDGDLDVRVVVDDGGEIGLLQAGFNEMVAGLRERLLFRDLLDRHVGDEVARYAVEHGVGLSGEVRELSALFVDVIGSTAMAASRPATEVVTLLNTLFGLVVTAVTAEGGWVNKFEGDAALCVFGAPRDQADHAARALRAARRLREDVAAWTTAGGLDVAIGVSSGSAVAGNVGSEERYEYTVIGDPVNEAARLCEVAKSLPGRLVASGAVVAATNHQAGDWASDGSRTLRGRNRPTEIFVPALGAASRHPSPRDQR